MRRFLLSASAALLSVAAPLTLCAADPVFPESFGLSFDFDATECTQGYDEDMEAYIIMVTGTTAGETAKITFDIPEGWDNMFIMDGSIGVMGGELKKRVPSYWPKIDDMLEDVDPELVQVGKEVEFDADGQIHRYICMLCAGDQVDITNPFFLIATVTKEEPPVPVDPVFPESFGLSFDFDATECTQGYDEDMEAYIIMVTGTTAGETAKITFDLPEGWDNIFIMDGSIGVMGGDLKKRVPSDWPKIDEMMEDIDPELVQVGKEVEFDADGQIHRYICMLCAGDQVDIMEPFFLIATVTKEEPPVPGEPVFPESFDLSFDFEVTEFSQGYDDDFEAYKITVIGTADGETAKITFDLPECWDGVLCIDNQIGNLNGQLKKSAPSDWPELDWMLGQLDPETVQTGTEIEFAADNNYHMGNCMLYSGDRVDVDEPFLLMVCVENSGLTRVDETAASPAPARFFDLQGREISAPARGLYIEVKDGKARKIVR